MTPGVYFDLPEAEYHLEPGLSTSGIKRMQASTMDFWAGSWMNPNRKEDDDDSVARLLGRAHHVALLEPDRFEGLYCPELAPETTTGGPWMRTSTDLKDRCREVGLKVSGTKHELIRRILDADPSARIWDIWYEDYIDGRQELKPHTWRNLAQLRAVVQADPVASKALTGGHSEVSIFWEQDGVPCKCRLDYWKPKAITDTKTIGNPNNMPIHRAILRAMASYQYHIQAVWYGRGVKAALADDGSVDLWHSDDEDPDYLNNFADLCEAEPAFVFVFAQTGPAPVVRTYVFPRAGGWQVGEVVCDQALVTYAECTALFGTDPWIDQAPLQQFDDGEFPAYMWD